MTTIPDIDTEIIESLHEIREQQSVLEERLEQMEAKKDSVSSVVYERVQGDYNRQLSELEEKARPLEDEARGEWARLKAVYQRIQELQAEARLEREELEFRHDLGEFDDDAFDEQVKAIEDRLSEHEEEIETMESLKADFVEAFGSEERLEAGAPEPPAAEEAEEDVEEPEAEPAGEHEEEWGEPPTDVSDLPPETRPSEAFQVGEQAEEVTEESAVPPPPGPEEVTEENEVTAESEVTAENTVEESLPNVDEATRIHSSDDVPPTGDLPLQPAPETVVDEGATRIMAPDAAASEAEAGGAEVTRILKKPRLETIEDTGNGESFILGALPVTIGRSSDNTIHLLEEAVSRHHAELIPGPDGFLLRDLGSENGTFVNGKRKKEHLLQDGDVVQIGLRKMAFREA